MYVRLRSTVEKLICASCWIRSTGLIAVAANWTDLPQKEELRSLKLFDSTHLAYGESIYIHIRSTKRYTNTVHYVSWDICRLQCTLPKNIKKIFKPTQMQCCATMRLLNIGTLHYSMPYLIGCVKKNFFLNFQKVVSSFVATIEKIT